MIKVSIITINLNDALGLRKTIKSVINQTYTDFEFIIIDGGSNDDSIAIINDYADRIDFWVSEPDKGIYNAMNKGIAKAKGEYLLFLNSGDWLVDEKVIGDFSTLNMNKDLISGDIYLWENENRISLKKALKEDVLSYDIFISNVIYHQSTFIKARLFKEVGLYSEHYKIVSDWEFFIKAIVIYNCSYMTLDREITYFTTGGISSQNEWMKLQLLEREKVFNSFPRIHKMYILYNNQISHLNQQLNEYVNLQNGRLGCIVRFAFWLKSIKKVLWKSLFVP